MYKKNSPPKYIYFHIDIIMGHFHLHSVLFFLLFTHIFYLNSIRTFISNKCVCMNILWLYIDTHSLPVRTNLRILCYIFISIVYVKVSVFASPYFIQFYYALLLSLLFLFRVISHKSKLTRWKAGSRLPHWCAHTHTFDISPHAFSRNFHIRDFLPPKSRRVFCGAHTNVHV